MDLTPVQRKILNYFETMIGTKGEMPTLRKAAQDNHVSHAAIAQTVKALEKKGYLQRDGRYGRRMLLLQKREAERPVPGMVKVPVVGDIVAGLPLYAQEEWSGTISLDSAMFQGDHLFALRVKGASMKNAGILDGDLVICEPQQYAENGEIVVALIGHSEATVKRFFLKKKGIELRPENPDFKAVSYRFGEVLVQGRVVGLVRTFGGSG